MTPDPTADFFETLRPRLFGIAYRMLGVVADAEDVVQEAYLRWRRAGDAPRSDEAWLVSVTTRLSIDRLRRAGTERAAYEGQWLPEPLPLAAPDSEAELADDLSLAFLLLLERLAPEERAAFLLREVFGVGYDEIARTLDKSEVACRQIVHRAKERVRLDRRRFAVDPEARERVARRFVEALRAEDSDGVLALLAEDAILIADGGGRMPALGEVQQGAERIAQLLVGFERMGRVQLERRGAPMLEYEVAWLNGEPAVLTLLAGKLLFATVLHLEGERIAGLYRVMNPTKLAALGRPTVLGPRQTLRDLL
ncbi:MAG TPA: RNA polymerase sigma factor SigJ [Gemmatimonadaceae bacterium]|nr:RNA polymerase sigma factor SigJ [Gemmatimonadaceae bacterium]